MIRVMFKLTDLIDWYMIKVCLLVLRNIRYFTTIYNKNNKHAIQ